MAAPVRRPRGGGQLLPETRLPRRGLACGLEKRSDGWWPRFDADVLAQTFREADRAAYWSEWERIRCPILIVRGSNGFVGDEDAQRLVDRAKDAELLTVPGAGHDVHLEQPATVARAIRAFIESRLAAS